MKWHFFDTGEHTGRYNMDYDMQLASSVVQGEAYLRLYRWQPYCISLGAHQSESVINTEKCLQMGIDIVKRPTGGRAILHAEELTYSVVMHCSLEHTPQKIYAEINDALRLALGLYNENLLRAELEHNQPDYGAIYKEGKGIACFAETAKNELKYDHKKLIGSAQRKMGNVILQHGSILCGKFHKRISGLLNISETEKIDMVRELQDKTIEIETILQTPVDYTRLKDAIKLGFSRFYEQDFETGNPVDEQLIFTNGIHS